MKTLRKLISMLLSLSLVFTVSTSAFAQSTELNPAYPFNGAIVDVIGNPQSGNYTEIITLQNGETFTFEHSITLEGNTKIIAYEPNDIVSVIEFNPNTQDLFMNGVLVEKVVSSVTTSIPPNGVQRSNWNASSTEVVNYAVGSLTVGALAAAIAGFTGGMTAAIVNMITFAVGTSVWLSAERTIYLNYVDYSPKVGGYYDSVIYSGFDASGSRLGTVTSNIFIR